MEIGPIHVHDLAPRREPRRNRLSSAFTHEIDVAGDEKGRQALLGAKPQQPLKLLASGFPQRKDGQTSRTNRPAG